jgi:predicted nucleic acid-binding protein
VRYVVDASVAAKWLLPEQHTAQAERLLGSGASLLAPDLVYAEVANVFWKRVVRGEVTEDAAEEALSLLLRMDLAVTTAANLAPQAFVVACELRLTVYDSLYVALALERNAPLVTADRRLCSALRAALPGNRAVWLGDLRV